ncbi:MAG: hypothetical protein Kow0042_20820 [Calditrichia bacterium]
MKKSLFIFTMVMMLLIAAGIQAQTGTNDALAKFGFGITLNNMSELFNYLSYNEAPAPGFTVPINISPKFRLEPEIGWANFSARREDGGFRNERSGHTFQLGIGVFPMVKKNKVVIYYGGRVGYISATTEMEDIKPYDTFKYDESLSGFYLAPATGGEYYFSPHLSAGGEIQLKYTSLSGDAKNETKEDLKSSNFFLRGIVVVRFYL